MANVINSFVIPVSNLDRTVKFYGEVFDYKSIEKINFAGFDMSFFPTTHGDLGDVLCKGDGYKPAQDGVVVYFNSKPNLTIPLAKVEAAGREIILPKMIINDEYGYMAIILDTEGNKIALHSQK